MQIFCTYFIAAKRTGTNGVNVCWTEQWRDVIIMSLITVTVCVDIQFTIGNWFCS